MLVPDEVRKCVAFLGVNTPDGPRLAGTAFFVNVPSEVKDNYWGYTVTAKHILDKIKEKYGETITTFMRVNLINGQSASIEIPFKQWMYHPSDPTVDVAVFEGTPASAEFDHLHLPVTEAATKETIEEQKIGVGDEVFMTGLFSYHYGTKRNIPIVRVGNIALMPDEPIQSYGWGAIEAYLIEARSIGGLSGSPVFVHLGGVRILEPSKGMEGVRFGPSSAFVGLDLFTDIGMLQCLTLTHL